MRCAVLGDPIAHSLSPVLHRAGYAAVGLDWTYDAVRVPAGGLRDFIASLDGTWRGLSLTMPLKREAMALVDEVTSRGRLVGAVNTLLLVDGRVVATNTDLTGAAAAVHERYDGPVRSASILGAGATAASTGLALCDLGATTITLLARSPERARETVEAIGRHPSRPTVDVGSLDDVPTGDVLVSTVPAGAQTPALVARCSGVPVVFEVLYDPWPTPLAAGVERDGRVLVSGLDLLVHQAAHQFEIFTDREAPLAVMRAAGEAALAERRPA
ncbi:shikimate 5-dehydrogenase [Nocardioides psychrotolerans]|uniref:Shikimate dehydrogenase n=1 Tax=Nocardioides psychrotolerans TaxID=1005945 RepID=A0A1I3KKN6_9ACTN|nr:shikimate dehydrogenase [Nocardioides psychrotolerans]GEP38506.1 shikimate 5-dehydrogenase [Nocardioides psychrotolerans]SFI73052.1 shikimate dehydrogenase [Nocardioides psychrotolerans]